MTSTPVLLKLSENDRIHHEIQNRMLILKAGTSIKIVVPITNDLFQLLRQLRVDVADALVTGVTDEKLETIEPLLLLRQRLGRSK